MLRGIREFLTYNRKQRNGIIALLLVALLLQLLIFFEDWWPVPDMEGHLSIDEFTAEEVLTPPETAEPPLKPFPFDPNVATAEELRQLGLQASTIQTLLNYRQKGGVFREAADLARIYGLDSSTYQSLEPYVKIKTSAATDFDDGFKPWAKLDPKPFDPNTAGADVLADMGLKPWEVKGIVSFREKVHLFRSAQELYRVYNLDSSTVEVLLPYVAIDSTLRADSLQAPTLVDLAYADTTQLKTLPGIGSGFARRIVDHREALGGFYSLEQLTEIYGLETEDLNRIRGQIQLSDTVVEPINLNHSSFEKLRSHPYLSFQMARNIVNFRERVRQFEDVEELRHIELIDAEIFSKIAPYLSVSDPKGDEDRSNEPK